MQSRTPGSVYLRYNGHQMMNVICSHTNTMSAFFPYMDFPSHMVVVCRADIGDSHQSNKISNAWEGLHNCMVFTRTDTIT